MEIQTNQYINVQYPISNQQTKKNIKRINEKKEEVHLKASSLPASLIKPLDLSRLKLVFPKLHKMERSKTIFVVAVGVNGPENKQNALSYATKDANDFNKFIMDKKEKNNGNVHVITLQDEYARKDSILSTLKWVQENSQPQDEIYVLMSGHGVMDYSTQHYFYLSYNQTISPDSLISDVWLGQILSQMKGNVKVFLDTCFSNNFNDYLSTHVKQYASSSFVSFAAAKSYQFSYESHLLKNGFFTYAILRGLSGAADFNGDNKVSNQELAQYTKLSIGLNSNGLQNSDFLVAK